MKNLRTKLSYALYTLLALAFLASCSDLMPTSEKFVVVKMQSWEKGTYKYQMSSVKGRGGFFMVSEHLYKQGDTLTLKPN